jgi:putative ABC transport system substrate-binding protein
MKRRAFIAATAGALAPVPAAWAQSVRKRRIGLLLYSGNDAFVQGLTKALREAGLVDGQNIEIVARVGQGREDLLQQSADELVREQVEVIVVWSTGAAEAAKRATSRIPIIASVADPLGSGLVMSLARPEANLTGVSSQAFEITGKRVDLLLEAAPGLGKLAFLGLRGETNTKRFFEISRRVAERAGAEMRMAEVDSLQHIERVVTTAVRDGVQGLTLQQVFYPQSTMLAELAVRLRLPAVGWQRPFADAGGLIAFGSLPDATYPLIARYVEKVLAGVPISDLPVEQSTRTLLIVNQRTAKVLGLSLPPLLLARADEVIE